jgi:hypothetical protein
MGILKKLFGKKEGQPSVSIVPLDEAGKQWLNENIQKLQEFYAKHFEGAGALTFTVDDLDKFEKILEIAYSKDLVTDEEFGDLSVSLGASFGEILCKELSLEWCIVTDVFGTHPAIRKAGTMAVFNCIDMVAKRMTESEKGFFRPLVEFVRRQAANIEAGSQA